MQLIKKIKELFKICDHKWEIYDSCLVHYPDYEPIKIGVYEKCIRCDKRRKRLLDPSKNRELYEIVKRADKENN